MARWGLALGVVFFASGSSMPACGGNAYGVSGDGDGDDAASGGSSTSSGGTSSGGGTGSGGNPGTGGSADIDRSCTATIQCTLASATCCGTCGQPETGDVIALRADVKDAYLDGLCEDHAICPACASQFNPHLFAECVQGTCEVQDLRTHKESSCTLDSECEIIPAACCACGAGNSESEIVAAGPSPSSFQEYQCAEADTVLCNDCAWAPPENLDALCEDGVCTLVPVP